MDKIKATRKDFDIDIEVREMTKDEIGDDSTTYYCDDETDIIYKEEELIINPTKH